MGQLDFIRDKVVDDLLSCLSMNKPNILELLPARVLDSLFKEANLLELSAEDMLKSAVIEGKKFKHSPRVGTDNPFGPKF